MNVYVDIFEEFGSFCADGGRAVRFRVARIDPHLNSAASIELDFKGVRNMNSSFCNGLIAGLLRQNPEALKILKFVNCRSNIKVLVQSAISIGKQSTTSV